MIQRRIMVSGGRLIGRLAGPTLLFIVGLAGCASNKPRVVTDPTSPSAQAAPVMTPEEAMAHKRQIFGQAQQAYQSGNYDEAITKWEEVLKMDSNHGPSKSGIERARAAKAALPKIK